MSDHSLPLYNKNNDFNQSFDGTFNNQIDLDEIINRNRFYQQDNTQKLPTNSYFTNTLYSQQRSKTVGIENLSPPPYENDPFTKIQGLRQSQNFQYDKKIEQEPINYSKYGTFGNKYDSNQIIDQEPQSIEKSLPRFNTLSNPSKNYEEIYSKVNAEIEELMRQQTLSIQTNYTPVITQEPIFKSRFTLGKSNENQIQNFYDFQNKFQNNEQELPENSFNLEKKERQHLSPLQYREVSSTYMSPELGDQFIKTGTNYQTQTSGNIDINSMVNKILNSVKDNVQDHSDSILLNKSLSSINDEHQRPRKLQKSNHNLDTSLPDTSEIFQKSEQIIRDVSIDLMTSPYQNQRYSTFNKSPSFSELNPYQIRENQEIEKKPNLNSPKGDDKSKYFNHSPQFKPQSIPDDISNKFGRIEIKEEDQIKKLQREEILEILKNLLNQLQNNQEQVTDTEFRNQINMINKILEENQTIQKQNQDQKVETVQKIKGQISEQKQVVGFDQTPKKKDLNQNSSKQTQSPNSNKRPQELQKKTPSSSNLKSHSGSENESQSQSQLHQDYHLERQQREEEEIQALQLKNNSPPQKRDKSQQSCDQESDRLNKNIQDLTTLLKKLSPRVPQYKSPLKKRNDQNSHHLLRPIDNSSITENQTLGKPVLTPIQQIYSQIYQEKKNQNTSHIKISEQNKQFYACRPKTTNMPCTIQVDQVQRGTKSYFGNDEDKINAIEKNFSDPSSISPSNFWITQMKNYQGEPEDVLEMWQMVHQSQDVPNELIQAFNQRQFQEEQIKPVSDYNNHSGY